MIKQVRNITTVVLDRYFVSYQQEEGTIHIMKRAGDLWGGERLEGLTVHDLREIENVVNGILVQKEVLK